MYHNAREYTGNKKGMSILGIKKAWMLMKQISAWFQSRINVLQTGWYRVSLALEWFTGWGPIVVLGLGASATPFKDREIRETHFSGIVFCKIASKIHVQVMQRLVFTNKGHRFICVSKIKLSIWKFVILKTIFYGFHICKVMYNVLKIDSSKNFPINA